MIYVGREKRPPSRLWRLMERRRDALIRGERRVTDRSTERILATGVTVSAIVLSLTGGLGIVVRALKNTDLTLSLSMIRSTEPAEAEQARARDDILPHASPRARG